MTTSSEEFRKKFYETWNEEKRKVGTPSIPRNVTAEQIQKELEERKKINQKFEEQRWEYRYQNWVKKRQKVKKECSRELFDELKDYIIIEQKQLDTFIKKINESIRSGEEYRHSTTSLVQKAQSLLFEWRKKNNLYQKYKEEIEELKRTKDYLEEER